MNKLSVAGLLAVMSLLASCIVAVVDSRYPERSWPPRSVFRRTVDLKPGGTLTLENARGNIDIRGWDEERIEISAEERRTYSPSRRIAIAAWSFAKLDIEVEKSEGELRIETAEDIREDESRLINFNLRVPEAINLRQIRNGRGNVRIADVYGRAAIILQEGDVGIENFSGSLEIRLDRGNIEAELLDLRPEDEVRIISQEGDILLHLEPEVDVGIEASSPNGNIWNDFDLKKEQADKKAPLRLTAVNGDIRIRKGKG